MNYRKEKLLNLLKEKAYHYREETPFTLASGIQSPHYLDCRKVTSTGLGMYLIGEILVFDIILHMRLHPHGIGGLTMGADPIANAASMFSYAAGFQLNSFSIRKQPKDHGASRWMVGDVHAGDRVIIVDDVITSGGSIIMANLAAEEYGLKVEKIIALVDREEPGSFDWIRDETGVEDIETLYTLSQFLPN